MGQKDDAKIFRFELQKIADANDEDYVIFTVDPKKVNVDFFPDPNVTDGIITKERVAPDAIIRVEDIIEFE